MSLSTSHDEVEGDGEEVEQFGCNHLQGKISILSLDHVIHPL